MADVQISAVVSESIKARLDRYARQHGVSKAFLIEQALTQHLQALEELPVDAIVPAYMVLDRASAEKVRTMVDRPPSPTRAMKKLFDDR